jgi:hypothetical protein
MAEIRNCFEVEVSTEKLEFWGVGGRVAINYMNKFLQPEKISSN